MMNPKSILLISECFLAVSEVLRKAAAKSTSESQSQEEAVPPTSKPKTSTTTRKKGPGRPKASAKPTKPKEDEEVDFEEPISDTEDFGDEFEDFGGDEEVEESITLDNVKEFLTAKKKELGGDQKGMIAFFKKKTGLTSLKDIKKGEEGKILKKLKA